MSCLISVVVPSFNQPDFVESCLDSIFSQTDADFEVLLVDGGSDRDTLAKIEKYKSRLAWFVSEKDNGQSHAINKGLRRAKGDVITWLNTDDFLLPGSFSAMAAAYSEHPRSPFFIGRGFRTDVTGCVRHPFYPDGFCFSHEALVWGLNFVLQPSTFFNRSALEQVGGSLDESLHFAMDTDLWLRLAALGEPCLVDHDVACSREYASTKTSTGSWSRFSEIQRVAQRHAGAPLTPGVLAEACRTLHETAQIPAVAQHLPPELTQRIIDLWGVAAAGLRTLCNRDDGLPVRATTAAGK